VIEIDFRPADEPGIYDLSYEAVYPEPGLATLKSSSIRGSVLIHFTEDPQADTDGVPDEVENQVPVPRDFTGRLGDGDNNRTADGDEPNVASLINPHYTTPIHWITFVSAPGTSLFNMQAIQTPFGEPPNLQTALGMFSFQVVGLLPGAATSVIVYPHDPIYLPTYYKYGREPEDRPETNFNERQTPHWYEFLYDGLTGAEIVDPDFDGITDGVILHFIDGQRGDDDLAPDGIITDPGGLFTFAAAPRISSLVINDGGAQRSKVSSLTIVFSELVAIEPSAFDVRKIGERHSLKVQVRLDTTAGYTVARLTFRVAGVSGGSLTDGRYRLTIRSDKVRSADGDALDGNADGSAGGNYVDEFFRRFGDTDGDGDVDDSDRGAFLGALGKRSRQAGYVWYLDANANGRIGAEDAAQFWKAYSRSLKNR
jgi:hypothetical protein